MNMDNINSFLPLFILQKCAEPENLGRFLLQVEKRISDEEMFTKSISPSESRLKQTLFQPTEPYS